MKLLFFFPFSIIKCKLYERIRRLWWHLIYFSTLLSRHPSLMECSCKYGDVTILSFSELRFGFFARGVFLHLTLLCVHVWHFLVIEISFDSRYTLSSWRIYRETKIRKKTHPKEFSMAKAENWQKTVQHDFFLVFLFHWVFFWFFVYDKWWWWHV